MSFFRYLLIQVVAYVIDLGSFTLLVSQTGVPDIPANIAGKILAGLFAFVAHRSFTFRATGSGNVPGQALRYFALLGMNIPLSSAILFGISYVIPQVVVAKVISDGICIVATYTLSRHFIFNPPKSQPDDLRDGSGAPVRPVIAPNE